MLRFNAVYRGWRSTVSAALKSRAATALLATAIAVVTPGRAWALDLPKNPAVAAQKPMAWLNDYKRATVAQQKNNKLIMMYFSGTGWDDFTQELNEQVFSTAVFATWSQNIIPLQVDFPKETTTQNTWLKNQNNDLKFRFNVSKVPTILFVDESGEVVARCGYDTARLRKEEQKEHPDQWLAYCDQVLKDSPTNPNLIVQKSIPDGVALARRKSIPLLLFISQGANIPLANEKLAVQKHPAFIKFVNRSMAYVDLKWPEVTDVSPAANQIRAFAKEWKFGPAPLEIVVWSPAGVGEFKDQITSVSVQNVQPLIKRLDSDLPKTDYNGGWLEDYRMAQTISKQQKKDLFMSFEQSDDASWSQNWAKDVYDTPQFKKYAKENMVLLRVNFPKSTTQPTALVEQNKNLADVYAIQGYPTMVILNPVGQKIGVAKYMKGGAATFVPTLDKIRQADHDRRVLPSEEAAKGT